METSSSLEVWRLCAPGNIYGGYRLLSEAEKIGISLKNCPRSCFFSAKSCETSNFGWLKFPWRNFRSFFNGRPPDLEVFVSLFLPFFEGGKKTHQKTSQAALKLGDRSAGRPWPRFPPRKKKGGLWWWQWLAKCRCLGSNGMRMASCHFLPDGDCWWRGGKGWDPQSSLCRCQQSRLLPVVTGASLQRISRGEVVL